MKTVKNGQFWGLTFDWFFGLWKILTQPMALKLVEMNGAGRAVQLVDGHFDPLCGFPRAVTLLDIDIPYFMCLVITGKNMTVTV